MAAPETSLIKTIQPYTSVFGTAFSLAGGGLAVWSAIKSEQRWTALFERLDQIDARLARMETKLNLIHNDVLWTTYEVKLGQDDIRILGWWDTFRGFVHKFRTNPEEFQDFQQQNHTLITEWAEDVVKELPKVLQKIDIIMQGQPRLPPLMSAIADRLQTGSEAPGREVTAQSPYCKGVSFFKDFLQLQATGIILLGNAYQVTQLNGPARFNERDFVRPGTIAGLFASHLPRLSWYLLTRERLPNALPLLIEFRSNPASLNERVSAQLAAALTTDLNALISQRSLYDPQRFPGVTLSTKGSALVSGTVTDPEALQRLNRGLLAFAFPESLSWPAIGDLRKVLLDATTASGRDVSRMQAQAEVSKPFLNKLNKYYQNNHKGEKQYHSSMTSSERAGVNFASTHGQSIFAVKLTAEPGRVVTGLQIVAGVAGDPAFSIDIQQAPFAGGRFRGGNTGWASLGANSSWTKFPMEGNNRVDKARVELPPGHVCTGAGFRQKGDRISLQLRGTKLDDSGNLIESSATWFTNDRMGNNEGLGDGPDFYTIQGGLSYVHLEAVEPNPQTVITGAQLFDWGNRMAIRVKPGLENKDNLWKVADIVDLDNISRRYHVDYLLSTEVIDNEALMLGA
jgi:hypothetical protein